MKFKTAELEYPNLDWVVAIIEHPDDADLLDPDFCHMGDYPYSTDARWAHRIIDRERIHLCPIDYNGEPAWQCWLDGRNSEMGPIHKNPLVAAMRAFVASRLGKEVELPEPGDEVEIP